MNKYLLIFIILFTGKLCYADEYILHLQAYHPTEIWMNNNVYGIGYKKENNIYGIYRNSIKNISLYSVREKSIDPFISYSYGLATGYNYLIAPIVTLNLHAGAGIITITPPFIKNMPMAIMFSIRLQ